MHDQGGARPALPTLGGQRHQTCACLSLAPRLQPGGWSGHGNRNRFNGFWLPGKPLKRLGMASRRPLTGLKPRC